MTIKWRELEWTDKTRNMSGKETRNWHFEGHEDLLGGHEDMTRSVNDRIACFCVVLRPLLLFRDFFSCNNTSFCFLAYLSLIS